jgi:phage terminase large subunit-like protein/DNA-directed RNA polymerase subunit H (RpoH/RPB5)
MPRKREMSHGDIVNFFSDGLTRIVSRPSIHGYIPHDKQIQFHSAQEKGRLYIGGNRSGKTVGGVVEDVWRMRGIHPYQPVPPPPTKGRIVTISYTEGIELIIKPELAKWVPPSDLINGSWEDSYDKQLRTLTLVNGSTCELMSYDQNLIKFAGTSRSWTHFDEEPPKAIFDECRMRLIDTGGCWYITMTPVNGMTWVYDDVYLRGLAPGGNIRVIVIDSSENPYISNSELELVIADLDENEKKARKGGKFVQIGGLVFKSFSRENVIAPLTPDQLRAMRTWTHYGSLDHGLNNPTAWLWHAAGPNGLVITYDEIYKNETLINQFAKEIHERNALEGRQAPHVYVGDPAISQRNAQTGDSVQVTYSRAGIPIVLGNNDVLIGTEKMNRYLESKKWLITENCSHLIRELQRVRWKVYENAKKRHENNLREEIHKKDDHAPDSARYFFSLMPDFYIRESGKSPNEDSISGNELVMNALRPTTPQIGPGYIDHALSASLHRPQTEWSHIDEHMGGMW